MAWLDDNPPDRRQFRCPRRTVPSGVVVVHTAENLMDSAGMDTGAEAVARFIQHRTDPGSYHDLVDSDSVVQLIRYGCEAFHDGTGTNPHSYGLSFACRTTDWPRMTDERRTRFVRQGAKAAARYAAWLKSEHGLTIPARRITRTESDRRIPGFISHAQRDPTRRTDPGQAFPWADFLDLFRELTQPNPTPPPRPDPEDETMFIIEHNGEGGTYRTRLVAPPVAVPITPKERKDHAAAGVPVLPTSEGTAKAILKQIGQALD